MKEQKIFIENLTREILWLMKEEMVAICTEENHSLLIRFFNGQRFRIKIEEL